MPIPPDRSCASGAEPIRLLLVEDDRVVRITVRDALEESGYRVTECADGAEALRAAEATAFALVLTDVRMPGLDGISLFRRLRQLDPQVAVIFMTAYADFNDAVVVVREGARDYIVKPFEMDELLLRVGRVRDELEFKKRMETAARQPGPSPTRSIRGTSPATIRLLERIAAAAATEVSVLIVGETGTGKELCARMIHDRSRRAGRPFVAVNCAAIPENLLESELFGHEKGAFTGADRRRQGRFEVADGGTLFLDEIGELPLGHQVKLLRAIETSTYEPVGSSRSVTVDVRVVSATNRDLSAAIASGQFRKDLFYRLNVIDLLVPPLRERRSDLPGLVGEFLQEIAARQGQPKAVIDGCALAALAAYDFPGNVRELLHALERAVAVARGEPLQLRHLPDTFADGDGCHGDRPCHSSLEAGQVEPLVHAVDQFEKQYIRHVLSKVEGHRGRAASLLGISRKSLWQRLREDPE